jgi:glucose-1-phosphate thymidylyltransferase
MKGIILAGGSGTRLHPVTIAISKQILPVYDKPMIYYPLSVLMLSGIQEILIISTPRDINLYKDLLGNGNQLGLNISYKIQEQPNGLAEAFIIGEEFIGNDRVALILGDNIFFGSGLVNILRNAVNNLDSATIFGYQVRNPERYGVVEFDDDMNVISIEEKPTIPKSNFAVPGLYFYNNDVIQIAKEIQPSDRGELEITSVNNVYLSNKKLKIELLSRGIAWLDTGTHDSLLDASNFVHAIQNRQSQYVSCIEEIAYRMNFISKTQLIFLANKNINNEYGQYLLKISEQK